MTTLVRFLRPHIVPLGTSSVLTVAGTAVDLARPWPLQIAVDGAISGEPLTGPFAPLNALSPMALAAVAAAAAVALVAAGGIIDYFARFTAGAAAERVGADMRVAVFARLQRLSLRFHDRNRTGDLVNRLTSDVSRVQDALVAGFETLLPSLLTLVGTVVAVLVIDPKLGLVALGVVPPLAVVVAVLRWRLKRAQRRTRALYGELASGATDVLRNVRVVQAFAREADEEDRFRGRSTAMMDAAVAAARIEAWYSPASDVVLALGSGLVLWLGVMQVRSGELTIGTLLVVLTYVSSVYRPIRSLARLASTLAKGAVSAERVIEILDSGDDVREVGDAVAAPGGAPVVRFRRVFFAYQGELPVLRDVSFEVAAGETVCVAGASGAGKSTLFALLLRLYDIDRGMIQLDGVDIRRITLTSLRERIALVPQDPWILDGTIADNIAFGRRTASMDDVRWAAHVSLVDEFVERLPGRYDTVVGEGGVFLSGGQRRRIALARAIVRGATLLVLDEPTTGLDAAAEAEVLGALRRVARGRTTLVASHAVTVAALADRVVVLDGGRVAAVAVSPLASKGGELDEADQRSAARLPQHAAAPRFVGLHDQQLVGQHRLAPQRSGWGGVDGVAPPSNPNGR